MSTEQTPLELGYGPAPEPKERRAPTRRWAIPPGSPETKCRSCGAPIHWVFTHANKRMPVNPDGVSHFETCPHAQMYRRVDVPTLTDKQRRILKAVAANEPMSIRTDTRVAWHECKRLGFIELAPNNARWLITELGKAALAKPTGWRR